MEQKEKLFLEVLFNELGHTPEQRVNELLGLLSGSYKKGNGINFYDEYGMTTGEAQIAMEKLIRPYIQD